jgi:hypothetical protein
MIKATAATHFVHSADFNLLFEAASVKLHRDWNTRDSVIRTFPNAF